MRPSPLTDRVLAGDRRWSFFVFNAFVVAFGAVLMAARISANGWSLASAALYGLFLVLQLPLAYGFTLAVTGWWLLRQGGDPVRINRTLPPDAKPGRLSPTAILMPIFNEDVGRVFLGLRVMCESLKATGHGDAFDLFILSDSGDANAWIAEEEAWFDLCRQVGGFGHIFYRKRRLTQHHKSGNIADFCRRWGTRYRYLIVLDADSVMTGDTLVRLASLMEKNPQAGMIQSFSRPVLGQSLFQRINQFASHAYAPLFVAGANFWQLDNASFYGHNAIIRVRPFMQFCAMPELPRLSRLGTRILSHDTIEAALIRRAGYEVWADYDLGGSYEESPPHLPASLQRDRRWCQGNMQHFWFLFSRGLTRASRLNILTGIMAYAGSPLWLLFLVLSPVLFLGGHAPTENGFLFFCAMLLLLTPKLLGAAWLISSAARRQAGGGSVNILLSIAAETIYSMLLAPILMLFYTQFVWSSFFGGSTGWGRQQRSDSAGPSWGECVARHGAHTALALVVACLVAWRLPAMLPWLALVLIGPLVAIPFSRLLASQRLGSLSRQRGLFLTPEESRPPAELQPLQQLAGPELAGALPTNRVAEDAGLAQVILDPRLNAIHVSLLPERQQTPLSTHERLKEIGEKLLRQGPQTLPPQEKKILLWDADAMLALHRALWEGPTTRWHQWWQDAFRKYLKSLPEEAGAAGLEKARLPSVDCDLHDPRARTLQLAANAPRGCPQAPSAGDGTGFAHRKSKVITH